MKIAFRTIGGRVVIIHPPKGHEPGHARLGPSSSTRWLACPASIRLSADVPERPSGAAAAIGTLIHAAMEDVLRGNRDGFTEADLVELEALDCSVAYAQDILDRAIDAVSALVQRFNIRELWLEERVWPIASRDDLWGTSDIIGLAADGDTLLVADLKTGRNKVDVTYNDQALLYGLGARRTFEKAPRNIALAIIQPVTSRSGVSVFECDADTIAQFETFVVGQLVKVDDPDQAPVPCDGCIFCPAKQICPAQGEL